MPQIIYRYHPMTGVYAGSAEWTPPYPGIALPGNATTEAPPECEAGTVAVYRDGAWVTLEDHRGETVYSTVTSIAKIIAAPGPLPNDVTALEPPDYPIWDADAEAWTQDASARDTAMAEAVRAERDRRLAECDWTQMPDAPLDDTARAAWTIYRQALRDVPQQAGFPEAVAWPDNLITEQVE